VGLQLTVAAFERIVEEELDALPDDLVEGLQNVAFVVEDVAEDVAEDGEDLLGRYEGVDLPSRGQYGFGELPDRIVVFRLPHLDAADTVEQLRDEVHTTLVHEIGHYYGLDDERLHALGWA
jgi:predicted Zn-dependent protease with MMP-like domain